MNNRVDRVLLPWGSIGGASGSIAMVPYGVGCRAMDPDADRDAASEDLSRGVSVVKV